jgi:hypothetical protein
VVPVEAWFPHPVTDADWLTRPAPLYARDFPYEPAPAEAEPTDDD